MEPVRFCSVLLFAFQRSHGCQPHKVNTLTLTQCVQDCDFMYSCNNSVFAIKADAKVKARAKINITVSIANSKDTGKDAAKSSKQQSKHAMLTIACPTQTSCKWCYYLEQSS